MAKELPSGCGLPGRVAPPAARWRSWSPRAKAPPPRGRAAASSGAGEDGGARTGQGAGGDSEAERWAGADLCGAGSQGCRVALAQAGAKCPGNSAARPPRFSPCPPATLRHRVHFLPAPGFPQRVPDPVLRRSHPVLLAAAPAHLTSTPVTRQVPVTLQFLLATGTSSCRPLQDVNFVVGSSLCHF